MNLKKIIEEKLSLLLYLVLSVFSVLPFFAKGFFEFHDDVQVSRVYEMTKSLSVGTFPVRWVSDLGYGVGYPIFNFYSVLPYYIGGIISNLGLDALTATKIVFVAGIVLSGVSMYLLVKGFFGKVPALVSSIIYLYFPYHAVNIYVRGDLAELTAYAFLPFVLLGFYKVTMMEKNVRTNLYIVLSSLSLAAVIISHNLSAFMLFIFLGIFVLVSLYLSQDRKKLFITYSLIFVVAFLISAFYAIPAVAESKYTNVLSVVGGGSDYHDHFVCPSQLWDSPWGFGGSAPGCLDGISFKLGKINIILGLFSLIIFIYSFKKLKTEKFIIGISFAFLFLSVFMTLPFSLPIWGLPYFDVLQFPWRFLNFVGLFGSFVTGYLIWQLKEYFSGKIVWVLAILIIGLTIITNMKLFVPQEMLDRSSTYYTNPEYLTWTASKISDEYLFNHFVSPKTPSDAKASFQNIPKASSAFYRLKPDNSGRVMFDFSQTSIEVVSDLATLVGVITLILVIIGKSDILYGKKTS